MIHSPLAVVDSTLSPATGLPKASTLLPLVKGTLLNHNTVTSRSGTVVVVVSAGVIPPCSKCGTRGFGPSDRTIERELVVNHLLLL